MPALLKYALYYPLLLLTISQVNGQTMLYFMRLVSHQMAGYMILMHSYNAIAQQDINLAQKQVFYLRDLMYNRFDCHFAPELSNFTAELWMKQQHLQHS